jgi:hypothetical protein
MSGTNTVTCPVLVRYLSGTWSLLSADFFFPELNLEGMADLMQYKLDFRIFGDLVSHLLDPGSPCLDQLQVLEYGSQNTIPDLLQEFLR